MSKAIFEDAGPTDFCVETRRARNSDGYGVTNVKRFGAKVTRAHRLAWIDAHGELPPTDKPQILHTCDNPPCIRPSHLYAGNDVDNVRDKMDRGRHRNGFADLTQCKNGHEFSPENTRIWRGQRICRACHAATERRRYNRLRAEQE